MREVVRLVILPVLVGVVVWSVTVWWIDRNPKTQIFYDRQTDSLLSDPSETNYDCVTRVSVWNPSRRVTSTDLRLRIRLPTTQRVRIGGVVTPEAPETIYLQGTQAREVYRREAAGSPEGSRAALTIIVGDPPDLPDDAELGVATVSVEAERLAPGSDMIIPIWWNSAEQEPDVAVEGTAYECVLVRQERTATTDALVSRPYVILGTLSIMLMLALLSGHASHVRVVRLARERAEIDQKMHSLALKMAEYEHRLRALGELD